MSTLDENLTKLLLSKNVQPEPLPSPPTVEPPSKLANSLGDYIKSLVPKASMDDIKSRLTVMGGPNAVGLNTWLSEAARGAGGLISDSKTLVNEPIGSQPWLNAGVREAGTLLGASRLLVGKRGFSADPYRGTYTPKVTRPTMASTAELSPPVSAAAPYTLRPKPTFRDYHEAYKSAAGKNDDVGAFNVVNMAYKDGIQLPVSNFNHMPHQMIKDLIDQYTTQPTK